VEVGHKALVIPGTAAWFIEGFPDDGGPVHSDHLEAGAVGFEDAESRVQQEIPHRCQVEELVVLVAALLQSPLEFPQFLVLQFQLGVVHLQLLHRVPGIQADGRGGASRPLRHRLLCHLAQY
jgi:hypothetical protein